MVNRLVLALQVTPRLLGSPMVLGAHPETVIMGELGVVTVPDDDMVELGIRPRLPPSRCDRPRPVAPSTW